MRIPTNVTREHVLAAVRDLDAGGESRFGQSRRYVLLFENRRYSPKAVLARAVFHATGAAPGPNDFSGGETTNGVLRRLGFDVRAMEEATPTTTDACPNPDAERE